MKIISKFKDYYDVMQAHGADDRLVLLRETVEHKLSRMPSSWSNGVKGLPHWDALLKQFEPVLRGLYSDKYYGFLDYYCGTYPGSGFWGQLTVVPRVVLFVGKPYVYFKTSRSSSDPYALKSDVRHVYDLDELNALIQEHRAPSIYTTTKVSRWSKRRVKSPYLNLSELLAKADFTDFALEHKAPIIHIVDYETCYSYPKLADIEFYKVIEPWRAYQELSLFLGNIAAPDVTPVKLSDKDRVQQHGFDMKYGFRTRPKDE